VRFLADAGFDGPLTRLLREAGHDVVNVIDRQASLPDRDVAIAARDDKRILLTEDRDFGRLVFAEGLGTFGIVYVRFAVAERAQVFDDLIRLIDTEGGNLESSFVVLEPGRFRISPLPNN
jgi:predicted nuclease of predicted toxin-antitoxin system